MDLNRRHKLTKEETEHVKKITNSGRLYYDYDPLIESARNFAYETCRRYNRHETDIDELRSLFEKLGKNPSIADGFITEFGFNLSIGDDFDAGCGLKIIDCNEVSIGNNVVIESNSVILPGTIIEDNVWIRPGSVVLGRIEADSICAGDPARRESK